MADIDEDFGSGLEQNYEYGQGAAEVAWAAATQDETGLNMANLPIRRAVANIDKLTPIEFALMRRNGFGGSDASVLLGANPYTDLYMEKHGRDGITEPLVVQKARQNLTAAEQAVSTKAAVRKGNDLEPLIMNKAAEVLGVSVLKPTYMYRFKQYPYLSMSFDGVGVFIKPQKKIIDPQEYLEEVEGEPVKHPTIRFPAPDFSWLGKHHNYAPVEIKVATINGQKHYNAVKAIYNEGRIFMGQNPWIEAPPPLTEIELRSMSPEEKANYFGIPIYYYPQVQQEMMALDANGGFLAVMFDTDWQLLIFYVQKDQVVWNQLIIEGLKAARVVNSITEKEGRGSIMALTPEMEKEMPKEIITNTSTVATAKEVRKIDPRWQDDF